METGKCIFILVLTFCYYNSVHAAGLGETCVTDTECTVAGDSTQRTVWCYNSQCACRSGFTRLQDRCVIGGDCEKDSDCQYLENSFCNTLPRDRAKCGCKNNFVPAANDTKCLREIGGSCSTAADCTGGNAVVCRDGICTCSDTTVPSEDGKQCILKAGNGEVCMLDVQCSYSDKAGCIQGRCQCRDGYWYNGTTCIGNLTLGDLCQHDRECFVQYDPDQKTVLCYNGQCSCKQGYIRESNRCIVGGDCKNDSECENVENSFCNILQRDRAKCACKNTFVPAVNNTKCLPAANKVGEGCADHAQCSSNLGEAECVNRQCACKSGIRAVSDNTKCGAAMSTAVSFACLALFILVKLF